MAAELPIEEALPALRAALAETTAAVLAAPPGAGKTTRVPLALMDAPWAGSGRILLLSPRRSAARAAAERMAETLGERPGARVGYRIRGETRVSRATRVEVVTEGVLTRLLQADPELPGIAAILFDEVHERSIHTDLGLALALEVQETLRPDLRLLAMSATLDAGAFARLLGGAAPAPVIASAGRLHPVETRWLDRPRGRGARLEDGVAELVLRALAETGPDGGDILAFLPGQGEIARTERRLAGLGGVAVLPLHGGLPLARQRAALRADADGRRRVVLATAIAETSLTVEGVRVVVDGGRARRSRVNPATGMGRLVTVPVSRAEAEQRRGRAGRLGPGLCYRNWARAEEGALPEAPPPEILEADLAPLALEIAAWGAEADALRFLDPPPAPALAEARALLEGLGALAEGRITAHGRRLAERPLHPRLAHMLVTGEAEGLGAEAALAAALLSERDPMGPGAPADLALRVDAALRPATAPDADRAALERIRAEAGRLSGARADPERARAALGSLLAAAYPDRIALRRPGREPRYLLSGGRGAVLPADDPLAAERLLVAADLDDAGREARIRRAAPIAEAALRARHGERIRWVEEARWDARDARVRARREERLGAIALASEIWRGAPPDALAAALAEGVRAKGLAALPWSEAALALRARAAWLRAQSAAWAARLPDWSDAALLARLEDWLVPHLAGLSRLEETAGLDLHAILRGELDRETALAFDRAAPAHVETPLGRTVAIDYARAEPTLSVRVQEMFGLAGHPVAGEPPVPLLVELLSPAGRPVQVTRDLPGFWAGPAYRDMVKEMRARYPKHPWPDDPLAAAPTRRAKPRPR